MNRRMLQLVHTVGAIVGMIIERHVSRIPELKHLPRGFVKLSPNVHFNSCTSKEAIIEGQYCVESFKSITQETEKSKSTR